MNVTLNLNARVWADFVLAIEDMTIHCQCKRNHRDPSVYLTEMLAELLLSRKTELLRKQRVAELQGKLKGAGPLEALNLILDTAVPTAEDILQYKRWSDEYQEDE